MFERLARLARAKEWLDLFRPLPPAVTEELRERFDVRLTYHSTAIEGNTLTQSETQIVLEKGVTVGGKSLKDHLEVIGHGEALDFVVALADDAQPLGEREIREIHSLVMKGQGNGDVGAYRKLDVMAAGTEYRYPNWLAVPDLMTRLASVLARPKRTDPVAFAAQIHSQFVTIHPFRDGNGRVGRLLMNLLLLRDGYPIAVIPVGRREAYIDALVAFQQRDDDIVPIVNLVANAVEASLRETLALYLGAAPWVEIEPSVRDGMERWLDASAP